MKNEFGIRCRQTPFLYKIQLRETGNAVGKDLPDAARHLADLFATLLEYKKRRLPLSPKRQPIYKTNLTNRQQKNFCLSECKDIHLLEYLQCFYVIF